jgi:hypothetical protein
MMSPPHGGDKGKTCRQAKAGRRLILVHCAELADS